MGSKPDPHPPLFFPSAMGTPLSGPTLSGDPFSPSWLRLPISTNGRPSSWVLRIASSPSGLFPFSWGIPPERFGPDWKGVSLSNPIRKGAPPQLIWVSKTSRSDAQQAMLADRSTAISQTQGPKQVRGKKQEDTKETWRKEKGRETEVGTRGRRQTPSLSERKENQGVETWPWRHLDTSAKEMDEKGVPVQGTWKDDENSGRGGDVET